MATTALSVLPHVGTIRSEIYPNLRAIPAAKKGVIAFVVDDKKLEVLVVAITYAGADWMQLTRDRTR